VKQRVNFFICGVLLVLVSSGCAQKIQLKALRSAEISDGAIKDIAVLPFSNDTVSQSIKIDSVLQNLMINGEKYFNVIDRVNLEKIMVEKKLNDSGLVDLIHNDSNGGLKEIRTIVAGEVALNSLQQSNYLEERIDYETCLVILSDKNGNKYCQKYRKYNMACVANLYSLTTNVKFIKVADSKIIFSRSFSKNSQVIHCADDNNVLPSKEAVNTNLASEIAENLISIVAPSYVYFTVTLLDDEDIDFTREQSKTFKTALELLKNERIEKANEILKQLNSVLKNKSYVVLYNLGVSEEALGSVYEAYEIYKKAENIAIQKDEVIEELSTAIRRVKQNIAEFEKTNKQLRSN
jgi:tetratricopeptide (TPR) repeat protein